MRWDEVGWGEMGWGGVGPRCMHAKCKWVKPRTHVLPAHTYCPSRGPEISAADSSSLMHADNSPLRGFGMVIDTALERAEAELSSNAVSTTIWELRGGEWSAWNSELESARVSCRPLSNHIAIT